MSHCISIIQWTSCSETMQWVFPVVLQIPSVVYTYHNLSGIEIEYRLTYLNEIQQDLGMLVLEPFLRSR